MENFRQHGVEDELDWRWQVFMERASVIVSDPEILGALLVSVAPAFQSIRLSTTSKLATRSMNSWTTFLRLPGKARCPRSKKRKRFSPVRDEGLD
jgi:hypothetical protein